MRALIFISGLVISLIGPGLVQAAEMEDGFRRQIEADWAAQERRLGRREQDQASLRELLGRSEKLLNDLETLSPGVMTDSRRAELREWQQLAAAQPDATARLELYRKIRWFTRELALRNPLLAHRPLIFLQQQRHVAQMLHEFIGYFYDYYDIGGSGGVFVLENPGHSFQVRELTRGQLPKGNFATLALSYDARQVYFAFAPRGEPRGRTETDIYDPNKRRCFHLFALKADGSDLRQLTEGPYDDFDPCPLPDGGLAFMSTRRLPIELGLAYTRCNWPREPIPTYTLHRLERDDKTIRTLSFHETNEWGPSVLHDGRIAYTRWDYVDRSAANFHGIWASNPDGTSPAVLFGNYTYLVNACYQPRAIPGSEKILFLAGAHHADIGGALVLFDPARHELDRATGEDSLESLERLTPEVCFAETPSPERPQWPSSFFHSPWPLSENYYLTAFSFDPLKSEGHTTGIYYLDRFGNLELLYRDSGICSMYPIPLAPRPAPPVVASALNPKLGEEGELVLSDVRLSLFPLPEDRPIKALRVYQLLPKTNSWLVSNPPLGHAYAESARMLLGTVPVEADGSAYFRAPAGKPLYFQAVDETGRAVQTMRSATYLQPGERRGCIGCHEPPGTATPPAASLALRRAASVLKPGPDGTRPMNYPRLVQPVLDRHCVSCHGSGPGSAAPALTGEPARIFNRSYDNLKRYISWYNWGDGRTITRPGRSGADSSRLTGILEDATHGPALKMPAEDRERILIWLDSNAPFFGTYSAPERLARSRREKMSRRQRHNDKGLWEY